MILGLSRVVFVEEHIVWWFKNRIGKSSLLKESKDLLKLNSPGRKKLFETLSDSYLREDGYFYLVMYYSDELLKRIKRKSTCCANQNIFYKNEAAINEDDMELVSCYRFGGGTFCEDTSLNGVTLPLLEENDERSLVIVAKISEKYWHSQSVGGFWGLVSHRSCSISSDLVMDYDELRYGMMFSSIFVNEFLHAQNGGISPLSRPSLFLDVLRKYDLIHWKFREQMKVLEKSLKRCLVNGSL